MQYSMPLLFVGILIATGCGDTPTSTLSPPAATPVPSAGNNPAPLKKSAIETVIGGFTGQTAVEKGKETRAKLEAIGKKEQAAMEEVMQ